MKKPLIYLMLISVLLSSGCKTQTEKSLSGLLKSNFEITFDGKKTDLYVLKNKAGMEVCISNFGARIVSVVVPDKNGKLLDVVLGYDSVAAYIRTHSELGASMGRYANRICDARFTLDGKEYKLPQNNGKHCLHSGPNGFHSRVFDAKQIDGQTIELTYLSKDNENGFPGNLTCKVTYKLTNDNAVDISYEAVTDKPTVINMTNHSYFNLDGDPTRNNSDYLLTLNADGYTPIDSTGRTSGEILLVKGTDMDFLTPTAIGKHINHTDFIQIKNGHGYDHNWVLNTKGDIKQIAAKLESVRSGIILKVYTTEPGVQFYSANFMNGKGNGKKGIKYISRNSVCLETEKFPDTPNKPQWPSAVLRPGEKYTSRCIYAFSVSK